MEKSVKHLSRAFTLIELLVVIAIIAILAAILFPVFAQAKEAAKVSVALSNTKQVGIGLQMYLNDNEDVFPLRYTDCVTNGGFPRQNWKHLVAPYVKSTDIYRDPVNPAAKLYDAQGDATNTTKYGVQPKEPKFFRGYFFYDAFFKGGEWSNSCDNTKPFGKYTASSIEEPTRAMIIGEHKEFWPDNGPWSRFIGPKGWNSGDDPMWKTTYNFGGGKKGDKNWMIVFGDSHAKFTPVTDLCGQPGALNMWQYDPGNLNFTIAGKNEKLTWMETFCISLRYYLKQGWL